MAKGKYEYWLTEEGLIKLEGWARDGLTNEQIANNMHISRETLNQWSKKYSDISDTLKKGKEVVDRQVENALLKKALGFKETVMKAFKCKEVKYNDGKRVLDKEHIEYAEEEVFIPPDTTAQIFWLKNRMPGSWRDKIKDALDQNEQAAKIDLAKAQTVNAQRDNPTASVVDMVDPHEIIIPELWDVFSDENHEHQIVTSGRAGTKSSYAGILGITTIIDEEPGAVVVLRKRHNKLRKTVYKEMKRAIGRLGLSKDDFDIGISPMQITYKATGNTIYFSGSDSIDDTKGIIDEDKPIKLVILDELTEFFEVGEGEEELTNIEATFVRGNDEGFRMVYLYNPPKNPNAAINVWCKKMELREDAVHKHVDYRDVPVSWIGKKLIESAEMLMRTDFKLYRWVWLGECIGVDELIYYMFNDNNRQETEEEHFKFIGIGVDYGQQNATTYQAAGLNINKRRLEGLDEFYHSGRESGKQKSPSEYAKEFIKFTDTLHEKYKCSVFYVYIDPSAQGLAEEMKRQAMQTNGYNVIFKAAENDVSIGIQRVQKCMTYQVLTVSENQPNLNRELGTYEYDKKSIEAGKEKPVKVDDHCCDALRYLVMGMWTKLKYFLPKVEQDED